MHRLSIRTGIPEAVLTQIASAGRRFAARVVLFGSRARGDHRPLSDMDIAFYGTDTGYLAFAEALEQLPTLLEFDCVHITDHTSPELIHNIRKNRIISPSPIHKSLISQHFFLYTSICF